MLHPHALTATTILRHHSIGNRYRHTSVLPPLIPDLIRLWILVPLIISLITVAILPYYLHLMPDPDKMHVGDDTADIHRMAMKFIDQFPTIIYRLPYGTIDGYAPAIPLSAKAEDVKLVGSYPDSVVLNLAAERDELRKKVYHLERELSQLQNVDGGYEFAIKESYAVSSEQPCSKNKDLMII